MTDLTQTNKAIRDIAQAIQGDIDLRVKNLDDVAEALQALGYVVEQGLKGLDDGRVRDALVGLSQCGDALSTIARHFSAKTPELRDTIALEVLKAKLAAPVPAESVEEAARQAYLVADAMLDARRKKEVR